MEQDLIMISIIYLRGIDNLYRILMNYYGNIKDV